RRVLIICEIMRTGLWTRGVSAENWVNGLACVRRGVLGCVCSGGRLLSPVDLAASLVPDYRPADSADDRRGRDRAPAPRVGGMPVALLGQPGVRSGDVGDRGGWLVCR